MQISYDSNMAAALSPRVRRQKFGLGALLGLVVFGAAFVAAGYFIFKSSQIDPGWTRTTGTVTGVSPNISNGSTTYTPVISYTANGQTYQVTANSGSSFQPTMGSPRQVAYNPALPQSAKVVNSGGTNVMAALFPVIGLVCLIIAPLAYVRSKRRSADINDLVRSGVKLQGVVTDIQSYGLQSNNGNTSYRVIVSAAGADGTVQQYTSDSLNGGLGALAMADFRTNPIPVDVYVNPANPADYYVDIADLPNMSPDRLKQLIQSAAGRIAPVSIAQPASPPFNPAAVPASPAFNPSVPPTVAPGEAPAPNPGQPPR